MREERLSISVTISRLDTATVKEDWVEIWDRRIAPVLDRTYVNEGQLERQRKGEELLGGDELESALRRGRRGHQSGLKAVTYAPFFQFWSQRRSNDDLEKILQDYLHEFPHDPALKGGDIDLTTLNRNLQVLEEAMAPRK